MPQPENLKRAVHQGLARVALASPATLDDALRLVFCEDCEWFCSHPINEQRGIAALKDVWQDLKQSFPDLERRDFIFTGGEHEDAFFIGAAGHYQGTFARDWLGIPATGAVVHLRYGELHRLRDGKIERSYALIDWLDLMRQAGVWPLMPSLGREGQWPGPATSDGLRLGPPDPESGARSIELMSRMHQGLLSYDGENLDSMDHAQYWREHFMWYGPSGIGTTRGLEAFQAHHQIPFLRAFPDRGIGPEYIRFGDGPYAITGGWDAMEATHTGPSWLGLPPTGRTISLRVMDFYRVENELLAENWVPIDILHILQQLGADVFGRMAELRR